MHQEEITTISLNAPNVSAPNFIKLTLKDIKSRIDPNTVVVEDFNTPLSTVDRSSRQEINKEILELNDAIDLTDIYRVIHPATVQYTFFSTAHGIFSKIDHILGTKQV
jgi:exonuclease III